MSTVIDASFAVDWLTTKGSGSLGALVIDAARDRFLAPVIVWHEVASALRSLIFRGQIAKTNRDEMLHQLLALRIRLDDAADIHRVISVSDRYSLTIYDAAYLDLAIRTDSDLATTDGGLMTAAQRAGVRVLTA